MYKRELEKRIEISAELENEDFKNQLVLEYYLIESEYDEQDELGKIITFGIEIDKVVDEQSTEMEIIRNFSCSKENTLEMIEKLAKNSVTPVSLRYIIDDMLGV